MPNRKSPLCVTINNGVLIISIGVDCLANAVKFNPGLTFFDNEIGEYLYPSVTHPDKFAQEVLRELLSEGEDGTTLVHIAIDKAAENAVENGAEGIEIPGEK